MLTISRSAARSAVTMAEAIEAAREAFIALSTGTVPVPRRSHHSTTHGTTLVMPVHASGAFAVKVVSVTPGNAGRGRPTVQAAILLFDESTGDPVALLEGTYLTQLRTGAAMGLGADLFALPDAEALALFGAGATARTSLAAVAAVRPIREVRVVCPRAEGFAAFERATRDELGPDGPILRRVESAVEALREAPIVITATTSPAPLFPGEAVESGAFVGALGAYTSTTRELDTALIRRARLVVDTREAALGEAGDLLIPLREGAIGPEDLEAEIGEVASGKRPGRISPDEIIVFKSVGNAMQDLALASLVYRHARERGLGTIIPDFE